MVRFCHADQYAELPCDSIRRTSAMVSHPAICCGSLLSDSPPSDRAAVRVQPFLAPLAGCGKRVLNPRKRVFPQPARAQLEKQRLARRSVSFLPWELTVGATSFADRALFCPGRRWRSWRRSRRGEGGGGPRRRHLPRHPTTRRPRGPEDRACSVAAQFLRHCQRCELVGKHRFQKSKRVPLSAGIGPMAAEHRRVWRNFALLALSHVNVDPHTPAPK
jgi:hypothetical protein